MNDDLPTDPGGSQPPEPLDLKTELAAVMKNAMTEHLKPLVDRQLEQDSRISTLVGRVARLEATRIVAPMALALAALVVSTVALACGLVR